MLVLQQPKNRTSEQKNRTSEEVRFIQFLSWWSLALLLRRLLLLLQARADAFVDVRFQHAEHRFMASDRHLQSR